MAEPGRAENVGRFALAIRVALVGLAAISVIGAFLAARSSAGSRVVGERYVCPMHPDVVSADRGTCPICGMDLVPMRAGALATAPAPDAPLANYVEPPTRRSFEKDIDAPAWVESDGVVAAVVFKDDAVRLALGAMGTFVRSRGPSPGVPIVATSAPPAPWDRSTVLARFRIDSTSGPIVAGDVGRVCLHAPRLELRVVAQSAVLETADGTYVLVASEDGTMLARRSVEVGRVVGGLAVVVAGLGDADGVVTRDAFFWDAEQRSRAASVAAQ